MKGLVLLQSNFYQLKLGSSHKPNFSSDSSGFPSKKRCPFQSGLGSFWKTEKKKPRKKFATAVIVKAAASSSPSLGAPASDYSGTLIGEQVKKKRRSIAGIDQDELRDPRHLADPDSCFCEFKGVDLHYKLCEPELESPSIAQEETSSHAGTQNQKIGLPMILLHGFGASAFSWHRVMKPFAQITSSKVLAFDRPAFGLTSRGRHSGDKMPVNPYSMAFSVLATLYFIDFLAAEKVVLVGHSAGSLAAVDTYFEAPDRVAALILVAPAIFAPLSAPKVSGKNKREKEKQNQENNSDSDRPPNLFSRLGQILSKFYRYIVSSFAQMWRGMLGMANSLYTKVVAAILRSALGVMLVRMIIDKFGIAAVKSAWYDADRKSVV